MSHPLIEGFRLSPPQRHVWLRQGGEVGPYRVCAIVSVTGSIDLSRVEAALRSLVDRHEILRTTYRQLPGMTLPMQVIESEHTWSLDREDLRGLSREEQAAAVDARFHALSESAVDLERGPVWRAHLLIQSGTEAKLLVMWPSLVADLASARIVVEEMARFVDGELSEDPSGDDLPLQHVEVAEWQHELLESDGTAAGREFWQQIDRDALTSCRLALKQPGRRTRGAFTPRSIASVLPRDAMDGVSRWAAEHGRTAQDVLLACWQLLMWRLTERTDLMVGVGSHGRSLGDLERVLGPLTKTLPVRFTVDPRWSFADLVERSCHALQDHLRWQSLFAWNMAGARDDAGARSEAHTAEFCPLAFDAVDWTPIRTARGTWAIRRADACLDRVDLKLGVALTGSGWQARWTFDEEVHNSDHVACIADQYISVLRTVATMAPPVLADFDVRGEWERVHARAVSVERYTGVVRRGVCAHQMFEARAAAAPEREAVVSDSECLTYGELRARADRIARFLHAQGVGAETRVGLFLEHSSDLLAAAFGILKAGAAFVPLPPGQPVARLAGLVDQVRAPIVLTHGHLAAGWPAGSNARLVRLDEDADAIASAPPMNRPVAIAPASLAYVLFTSGSTGAPKGVMISHGALANYLTWSHAAYLKDADVSVPLHASIGFDATITSLLLPLCAGARVVVTRDAQGADVIARVVLSPHRFGFLKITPAHLALIAGVAAQNRLASLADTLVIGGEALDSEQLAAWQAQAPGTRVVNEYGPTEATVGCVVHDTTAGMLDPGPVPIGYPIANVACHVLDACGHPAAVGVTGELYIGGAQLARGYEGRPDLTAERFVPDPFAVDAGARCYQTGDLVRVRTDGSLDYVGRRDQQVKLRGYRVELGEVEVAVRQQAGIRDAAVLLREDVSGERRLVAYVVTAPEMPVASDRLQQALRVTLPDYMVPAVIVPLDALPMTANGKVDRRKLPAPAGERPTLAETYIAPRTRAEAILARLWAEVLRLDRVGIHDNFFALGGDSILSLQIVARAAQAGLKLAPRLVFEHQTIEALAGVATETMTVADQSTVTGAVPLTPIQHWFFDQPIEDRHHYNQSVALDLMQPLEPERLTAAWLRLQLHHDAMRLRFRQTDRGWEQTNAAADEVTSSIWIDASGVAEGRRDAIWARIARQCQTSLDLERGPIARAALVNWGADTRSRLLIVLHHVVIDGLSWRVLLEDLQQLCASGTSGTGLVELPPKTTSLKVWSEKLTAFVNSGALDDELPVWIGMSEPAATIGRDRAAGGNTVASQQTVALSFTVEETEALLHRLPAALDVHVQDALLTGLVTALSQWSGDRTWRIDLEGHGREVLWDGDDVSRTLGWFTSVYPIRLTVPAEDDPVAALRDVRAAVRRMPRHGVGYGVLRYLRDGEIVDLLRSAESPEVIFNYWGQLDQVFSSSAAIRPAHVSTGAARSPRQARGYVFEVSAGVIDGRLQVLWTFSRNLHAPETIERLVAALRETVSRVSALPDRTRAILKTPADFPLVDVTQAELDGIVAEGGPVGDMYPLSSMQEGMLFHRLYESDESVYGQQFAVRLNGALDPVAFRQAWEAVVARHDILRTGFFWKRRERPLQVVRERATLPWTLEDWRDLTTDEQEARLAERLKADARQGFTFEEPPLMRLGLVRLHDERWHVLWTSHHIVLDGWSMPILVRDVLTAYAAAREHRAPWSGRPAARYGDYIGWLQRQDAAKAEAFWRNTLDGFQTPSLLAAARTSNPPAAPRQFLRTKLPSTLVEGLQQLGTEQHMTMNTWCAGAWGLLLAHCTRQRDIAFGTVVSGRPADLPDAETIPGLFINTLPLRLKVLPGTPALSWFAECQRRQVETRDYEYSSLARIQSWSAVPAGTALFDTLFVYENYPVEHAWREQSELRVEQASASVQTNFPLAIEVAGRGSDLGITVAIDGARISPALGGFVRDGFEAVLSRVLAAPDITVGALLDSLDELSVGDTRQPRSGRRESLQSLRRAATRPS